MTTQTDTWAARKPRVLMFAPAAYPPAGPEAIVTCKLILAALEDGWDIDVISMGRGYERYPVRVASRWNSVRDASHFVDMPDLGRGLCSVARRALAVLKLQQFVPGVLWSELAAARGAELMARKSYDAVFSRVTPDFGHLPALCLARKKRMPWLANWNDPVPPSKYPDPYGKGSHVPLSAGYRNYLRAVMHYADWHTFPSERLRRYVSSYIGDELLGKSSVVPHIALPSTPKGPNKRTDAYFTLCHFGSLEHRPVRHLFTAIRALTRDRVIAQRLRVTLIGYAGESVSRDIGGFGIGRFVRVLPSVCYDESLEQMKRATVLLLVEAILPEGIFLPSKVADYVECGRPILAISPRCGVVNDLISEHGGGLAADGKSWEAIAQAICRLFNAWSEGTLDTAFSVDRLYNVFHPHRILSHHLELLRSVKRGTAQQGGDSDGWT